MEEKNRRIDWQRVIYVSSILAILYLLAHWVVLDGHVPTLLTSEGREITRQIVRDHFPGIAKRLGMGSRYASSP